MIFDYHFYSFLLELIFLDFKTQILSMILIVKVYLSIIKTVCINLKFKFFVFKFHQGNHAIIMYIGSSPPQVYRYSIYLCTCTCCH